MSDNLSECPDKNVLLEVSHYPWHGLGKETKEGGGVNVTLSGGERDEGEEDTGEESTVEGGVRREEERTIDGH